MGPRGDPPGTWECPWEPCLGVVWITEPRGAHTSQLGISPRAVSPASRRRAHGSGESCTQVL